MAEVFNFDTQLQREQGGKDLAERAIRRLWSGVATIAWLTGFGAQRRGQDIGVTLSNGEYFTLDLKVRPTRDYGGDILLELFSIDSNGKRRPGWALGSDTCGVILYIWNDEKALVLPGNTLRAVTRRYGEKWFRERPPITATTHREDISWTMYSIAVSTETVLEKITNQWKVDLSQPERKSRDFPWSSITVEKPSLLESAS